MNSLTKKLNGQRPLGVYYESWSAPWNSDPSKHDLVKIPSLVNIVFLSFATPSCTYKSGSNTFAGTGLDFSSDFSVIKGAIQILKQRGVVVMLSVGGATYHFDTFNASNLASFCNDLGCDGIDIDWEDPAGAKASSKLGPIINSMRKALPNGLISMAGFSVGAYGQGSFTNAQPASNNTGMNIEGIKSNGFQLDFINIMSYDAGPTYSPTVAYDAFRSIYSGPLLIGEEIPPEAWGGHVLTLDEVKTHSNYIISKTGTNGIFVWSYQKSGKPSCMDIINTANTIFKNKPQPTPTPDPQPIPTPIPVPDPKPTPTPIPNPTYSIWKTNTNYKKGDNVSLNGINYTCLIDNISSEILKPDVKVWQIANISWSPNSIQYNSGDIVSYNGNNYKCINSHTSNSGWTPDSAFTLWSKI